MAMEQAKETQPIRFLVKATPRPLIKWKSFWLGILVLGFLGWAWVRSSHLAEFMNWKVREDLSLRIAHSGGSLDVWVETTPSDFSPLGLVTSSADHPTNWFPERAVTFSDGLYSFSYWLIILLFLVPWVGFLAWRVRRQRKHTS